MFSTFQVSLDSLDLVRFGAMSVSAFYRRVRLVSFQHIQGHSSLDRSINLQCGWVLLYAVASLVRLGSELLGPWTVLFG